MGRNVVVWVCYVVVPTFVRDMFHLTNLIFKFLVLYAERALQVRTFLASLQVQPLELASLGTNLHSVVLLKFRPMFQVLLIHLARQKGDFVRVHRDV